MLMLLALAILSQLYHLVGCIPLTLSLPKNLLELNPHIVGFKECSVRIIQTEINVKPPRFGSRKTQPPPQSYELTPLKIPVMLTKYTYQYVKYPAPPPEAISLLNEKFYIYCNGKAYILFDSLQDKIQIRPDPKLNCAVIVYIDPYSCEKWLHSGFFMPTKPYPSKLGRFLPESLLDTMFTPNQSRRCGKGGGKGDNSPPNESKGVKKYHFHPQLL